MAHAASWVWVHLPEIVLGVFFVAAGVVSVFAVVQGARAEAAYRRRQAVDAAVRRADVEASTARLCDGLRSLVDDPLLPDYISGLCDRELTQSAIAEATVLGNREA